MPKVGAGVTAKNLDLDVARTRCLVKQGYTVKIQADNLPESVIKTLAEFLMMGTFDLLDGFSFE